MLTIVGEHLEKKKFNLKSKAEYMNGLIGATSYFLYYCLKMVVSAEHVLIPFL